MSGRDVKTILKEVDALLAGAGELPPQAELAVEKLLNVVETLCSYSQTLSEEVERLRKELEKKKRPKTTSQEQAGDDENSKDGSDHSSEKQRRQRERKTYPASDRRSFKDLEIHQEVECPVDPATLPPDAQRVSDDTTIVQNIEIKPHNVCFRQHVYYSAEQKKYFRGPLPAGYDVGDFGSDLRALILSLKYCGNMSEPKIGEFLENFKVQISAGSLSNILTNPAASLEQEYHDVLIAGLSSTTYQQTDDTSARVAGQFWHTHILCNPYYTWYSTRPGKDRLSVLAAFQNLDEAGLRFNEQTLTLLKEQFAIPAKWQQFLTVWIDEQGGDVEFSVSAMQPLLDEWFQGRCQQTRTAIEQAAAIISYRLQTSVPIIQVLVCDDAGQFKLLTPDLGLCWIHAGRHFAKLSPVAPRHEQALSDFTGRYWDFYAVLQDYRAGPNEARAVELRQEFDELFATRTGYDALDDRIAMTAAKRDELLTVLSHPSTPLHNNASELGARVSARRRDVSLHCRSSRGARAMDIFTTLAQTCKQLGLSAYAYFQAHLQRSPSAPSLAACIGQAAAGLSS